ncbi:MAG: hypothetical protein LLG02_13570 [Pelosinus sp.]|nr:hypothetical protein [Pelosinus sp.]
MNPIKKLGLCLLTMIFMVLFSSLAWAQTVSVTGQGASRDDAVRDALRSAVEQAVGTLVDSQTIANNNQIVTDEIYVKSQGFVEDYHVDSVESSGGVFNVKVTANINTNPDSALYTKLQKLKLIEVMLRDPRIAVIIPEFRQSTALSNSASETAVVQKLRDAGFKYVLDVRQLRHIQDNQFVRAIMDDNIQDAVNIATTEQLDYVIVGEATCQYAGAVYGSSIESCRASVNAKVLKVDTGEIIAAQTFVASGVDITPAIAGKKALSACGNKVGDFMVQQLMKYASDPDKPVTVLIKRADFNHLSLLQKSLKQVSGVKSVFLRSYHNGDAQIDVVYTGAPRVLADSMQNIEGLSLDIVEINGSSIQVTFR